MQQVVSKTIPPENGKYLWRVGESDTHYFVVVQVASQRGTTVHAVPKDDYQLEGADLT